jgi:hypothetical protein
MVFPLGPIEALPRKATARWPDRPDIEANAAEPLDAGQRHFELFVGCGTNIAPRLQSLRDGNADLTGEVTVAASTETELPPLRAERPSLDRRFGPNRGKLFEYIGDVGTGKAVIAMPPPPSRSKPARRQRVEQGGNAPPAR